MESVLRTLAVYVFLLVLFRLAGKRSVSELDTFDMLILLIISEATQGALIADDYSLTTSFVVITTLVLSGVALAFLKQKSPALRRLMDGLPVLLVDDGKLLHDRMEMLRVDIDDLLEAAHLQEGIGRIDEIRYAILERNGKIAIIPRKP
jgi:uncharacterized membrane protein YcaP (DUF421 family)